MPRTRSSPSKRSRGRQPFVPTAEQREQVWAALALGLTIDELRLGVLNPENNRPIDAKTFRKNFADEIATAKVYFKMEIAAGLVKDMRVGRANSTRIFLSKAVLGLRDIVRNEFDPESPLVIRWENAKS